jgi:hypothetical protein
MQALKTFSLNGRASEVVAERAAIALGGHKILKMSVATL